MTALATPLPVDVDHRWELRLEEFEDGHSIRRFDCVDCGAVRFEGAASVPPQATSQQSPEPLRVPAHALVDEAGQGDATELGSRVHEPDQVTTGPAVRLRDRVRHP